MSRADLERTIPVGDRLLLDSTTLISYLGGGEDVSPIATCVLDDFVLSGRNEALVSMVTVMELLVRPLRRGPEQYRHVLDFVANFPNLRPVVVDLPVAQEAAALRATHGFRAADALTIATGLIYQVGCLVTNDRDWSSRLASISSRIQVCRLQAHLPFP